MESKAEVLEKKEVLDTKSNPNVHFESSPHRPAYIREFDQIGKGNLEAHVWIKDLTGRLRQYKPAALIIDSMTPDLINDDNSKVGKKKIWAALPGHPKDINEKDEILVGLGDCITEESVMLRSPEEGPLLLGVEAAATVALLSGLIIKLREKKKNANGEQPSIPKTSRRKFLKIAGGGTALAAGALLLKPDLLKRFAADSSKVSQYIGDVVQEMYLERISVDARTALMIAKAIDMQRKLVDYGLDPSGQCAVIAGTLHMDNSDKYLSDSDARSKTIRDYTGKVLEALSRAIKLHPEWGVSQDEARHTFLDYISRVEVVRVTDPGVRHTNEPGKVLDENIKHVGTFYSKEVEEAIAPLRVKRI